MDTSVHAGHHEGARARSAPHSAPCSATADAQGPPQDSFKSSLQAEQARQLYESIPAALANHTALALILASALWPPIAAGGLAVLLAWASVLAVILLATAALAVEWRSGRACAADLAPRWLRRFRAATMATGLTWGAGAVLLFPEGDALHQAFLAFVLAGASVGTITPLAVDRVSAFGPPALMLIPLAARLALEGNRISLPMDAMIALCLIFVATNATRAGRSLRENVRLRIEAGERELALRAQNRELNSVAQCSPDNIIRYDRDCRAVFVNRMMEKTVNVASASLIGKTPIESRFDGLVGVENYQAALQRVIGTGEREEVEVMVQDPGGNRRTHHIHFVAERDTGGNVTGALAFGRDITEHKLADAEIRIAAAAFDAKDGMVITDAHGVILRVNRGFTDVTGYTAEEAAGRRMSFLHSGRQDAAFYAAMWEAINRDGAWRGEVWNRRKCGEIYPQNLGITAVRGSDTTVTHYVATLEDITQRKAADEKIRHLALYDSLTRLPNRRLLLDRLEHALAASLRNRKHGALMFIDLDNFKALNDTHGHYKGDLLLQQAALRLSGCVREDDTVARLGDDEFVVILENMSEQPKDAVADAEAAGKKILAALSPSYLLDGCEWHCTQSIGISLFGGQPQSVNELLTQASLAMARAKSSGRNTLLFFDPGMQAMIAARAALEADVRVAMQKDQILLHYQPQVDRDGLVIGTEALVRWQHPDHGMVAPGDFVSLAEEIGLILPIGRWVLETACARLASWSARAETAHIVMSVNVSARQLLQPDFVEQVLAALDRSGARPDRLKLELTESLLVDNVEDTILKMSALKARGIKFSLDDFGTGYSSLSYLKRLPLDQLKIDQSFVRDVLTDPNDAAIARTIVMLAQNLGLDVIAEGVETEAQRSLLAEYGCHSYQGYLFSRPLPAGELEAFIVAGDAAGKRAKRA